MARFGAEWIYISELETLGQVKIGNQENFWIADASDAEWIYTYPHIHFGSRAGEERLDRSLDLVFFRLKNWKPRNKFVLPMLLATMSICFKCDFSKCGSRPVGERWEWEGPISLIQPEAFEFLGLEFF